MIDRSVTEISSSRPLLRRGIRLASRHQGEDLFFLLEDPLTGKFFEIGEREHALISLLNGKRTVSEIVALSVSGPKATGLTENEAVSMIRMLGEANLLEINSEDHALRKRTHGHEKRDGDRASQKAKGLFFVRLPLGNPDHFLTAVNRFLGPIPGGIFFALWFLLVAFGVITFAQHSDRFLEEMQGVLKVGNLALLGGVWILLKVVHEFCHGIVCKRYGGSVPEAGVSLLLFVTPLAYVDASSSIRFPSKWNRILVAAAGMLGEFAVASLAILIWAALEPGVVGAVLHQVVVISTVTTVLFNANPLMRFDGYYMASDLLGISNLYTKGQKAMKYLWKRWLLGIRGVSFPFPGISVREQALLFSYGVASAVWRVVVMVGLFVAACLLFQGVGKILAVIVAAAMILGMVRGTVKYFRDSAVLEKANPFRLFVRFALFAGLLYVAGEQITITPSVKAPAILDPGHEGEIRVECPGFLEEVHVGNGSWVEEGDLILTLANPEVEAELVSAELAWARAKLRADSYLEGENIAGYQAEKENVSGLESKKKDLQSYVGTLEMRAPMAGQVYARELKARVGEFLDKGSVAVRIVNPERPELRIAVAQDRLDAIGSIDAGDLIEIFDENVGQFHEATLKRIRPQAVTEPPHPGLTTLGGGPLVVRDSYDGEEPVLVSPHFTAIAELPAGSRLREGALLWARFAASDSLSLADWTMQRFQRWASEQL
ncbi:MAG: HlyD family efflux transporter periplasmic adaptor subunit [Verrucomicrobiota bacterium]